MKKRSDAAIENTLLDLLEKMQITVAVLSDYSRILTDGNERIKEATEMLSASKEVLNGERVRAVRFHPDKKEPTTIPASRVVQLEISRMRDGVYLSYDSVEGKKSDVLIHCGTHETAEALHERLSAILGWDVVRLQ